jgi:hypothetical protein
MSVQRKRTAVVADLTLRVPRGEAGSLHDGSRAVLEQLDTVRRVEVEEIRGMRPDAFDCYVDATVTLALALPAEAEPREALRDGFGVVAVDRCTEA